MSRHTNSDYKIYVGDLGSSASKQELEDAFGYYGPLRNVWVARNPPGFAFIEFEDARDADDAVRGLDGRTVCGRRVRVEHSSGVLGRRRDRGPPPRRGRAFHPDDRCYECGERGHYARDCKRNRPHRSRKSRSYSRSRSRSRGGLSKSRSHSRERRSRSGSKGRSRSPEKDKYSPPRRDKSSSRSRSRDSEKRNGTDD